MHPTTEVSDTTEASDDREARETRRQRAGVDRGLGDEGVPEASDDQPDTEASVDMGPGDLDMPDPEAYNDPVEGGLFVALEGIDGSGKTTVAGALEAIFGHGLALPAAVPEFDIDRELARTVFGLKAKAHAVAQVPEVERMAFPTDTELGDCTRDLMADAGNDDAIDISPFAIEHANAADLALGTERRIRPALDDGKLVIVDRYTDSLRAYQSERNAPEYDTTAEARRAIDETIEPWEREPDVTILLDASVSSAIGRRSGGDPSPADRGKHEFMGQVREAYRYLALGDSSTFVVDASQDVGEVIREATAIVTAHLPRPPIYPPAGRSGPVPVHAGVSPVGDAGRDLLGDDDDDDDGPGRNDPRHGVGTFEDTRADRGRLRRDQPGFYSAEVEVGHSTPLGVTVDDGDGGESDDVRAPLKRLAERLRKLRVGGI